MTLKPLLLLPLCLMAACSSASLPSSKVSAPVNNAQSTPQSSLAAQSQPSEQRLSDEELVSYARKYLGTRYIWGGSTPKGFDCSGYIQYVYRHFDIDIPRTTAAYPSLYDQAVSIDNAQVGDIIVFTGTDPSTRRPGHAGIITQVGKGKLHFIHSSSSKRHFGVTETDYYNSGYPKRFSKLVRVQ
ncbi:Cell wall-associated hydrolase, NlpC family [Vibrio xiamenensis]|uniref:Cell wall-associated hydrolase, NlpC family n=1 Tax=Vibrio xiamenensis TaxID=861298 RepID=A0A1G7Y4N6_9VIBR|nr:C40 family peptidase [Vibrio xiamenensis]SDG91428.1 Cell wall-associated hydrolase, NlpC family [Vibrio xiamenensis]